MRKIGKYDVIREIGAGGFGTVYQAYDPFKSHFVALKVSRLKPEQTSNAYEHMFFNETNMASHLHHPNIIEIYDAGVDGEIHYIAMEYIAGGASLEKFCRPDNLLPLELIGEVLFKCAEALDYAHRKGVIHRDIKPHNILLRDERDVKVSDFGLALLMDPDLVDTRDSLPMGSPKYMSPETISEEGSTQKSDIFSLGVVMYEALTGHHPFPADTLPGLSKQIMERDPIEISHYRPNLPSSLNTVVRKAMAKRPENRYKSALDFAADLSVCFHELNFSMNGHASESRAELLKQLSFFNDFGDAEIWELLRWSEWQKAKDGEQILSEGEVGETVYLIVQGNVDVIKNEKRITTLGDGELFGEIAWLANRPRSASVRAKGDCILLRLNVDQIERTSSSCQIQFQRIFISMLIERLIKTTEQLAEIGVDCPQVQRQTIIG
ncbi:MAG: cyclic nucleotide-binding domain-containing protein [Gammaproteobacteria bacterium]|nr:MAG: cyclic nucleotide-binding domain-containing protein [Gammaproteobacteria bacterium]